MTVAVQPVRQGLVVRSEWIKLRTLRSTYFVLGATVIGVIALGVIVSYVTKNNIANGHVDLTSFSPIDRSLVGVNLAQLTLGVLGVVVITGEYSTGMIRATLGAVPRRVPVLVAKVAVFAAVAFALSLVSTFAAFVGGQAILGHYGVSLSSPGALRSVFGAAMYLTVAGLAGMALGFLIRSTAGGIAALFGILLVLPPIVGALPASWANDIGPYLPSTAGQAIYTTHADHAMLSPWAGFGMFCLYVAAALVAATVVLRRRDA
jgi:ABC-2 type transport system permease protein